MKTIFLVDPPSYIRDTGEITLEIPALPRPTLEELKVIDRPEITYFPKHPPVINMIASDTSPVEAVTFKLGSALAPGEEFIDDEDVDFRIGPNRDKLLGFQHAIWLVQHQDELPGLMALASKPINFKFPGIMTRKKENGIRSYPFLRRRWRGKQIRWTVCWGWHEYILSCPGNLIAIGIKDKNEKDKKKENYVIYQE